MRARACCRPGASIGSDGSGSRVVDSGAIDLDTVHEPVAGDTCRDIGADDVEVDHGKGVEAPELVSALGGYGHGRGGVDLFFGDLLAGLESSNATVVQGEGGVRGEILEVVGDDAGGLEVRLDGLDVDVGGLGRDEGEEGKAGGEGQGENHY